MHKRWPWVAVCASLSLLVACPGGGGKKQVTNTLPPGGDEPAIELPNVPAKVETVTLDPTAGHDPSQATPVLEAMLVENQRWAEALGKKRGFPAYYVAHQIQDRRVASIEAESGSLLRNDDDEGRLLDVEVRVGNPRLDNRRQIRDDRLAVLYGVQREARIPMGNDAEAIRHYMWLETDRRYREAVLQYKMVATAEKVRSDGRKAPPDFSHEKPETFIQAPVELAFDKAAWEARVRACSLKSSRGVATRSTCRVDFTRVTSYFVNSEGGKVQMSWTEARFSVSVGVKADDGMSLGRTEQRFARSADTLPSEAEVEKMILAVNADLDELHGAPIVDPYSGPAILQGRAAAVFFHEVFGHRIEGHRQKDENSGQTFSSKLGERIMPEWMSVYDDPTITTLNGTFLNGFYRFDDEGVRAQRAKLVRDGVLEGFAQGRQPLDGFPQSNGHGRHEPGLWSVSRQGNLVVEAAKSVPDPQLKQMLVDEVKRQGKPYGMMFTDISGGFTNTSRFLPQSFKVNPIMAYRVYPDGREELVRGVDIEGTPLIALGSIMAAGRSIEVFNGVCGAESGWVPVSASAPSLLLKQIEVARSQSATGNSSPTLPPPSSLSDSSSNEVSR